MGFSLKKANAKHNPSGTWPKEKKLQVVAQWLALGNLRLVSEVSGVSYSVIRGWRGEPWWNEFENEIRRTEGIQLDSKISKLVNKALEQVEDRLDNGDIVLNNKTGELVRKPVQMRDIHKVASDLIGKREEIRRNQASQGQVQALSVQEQLKVLAQEFARMTQGKPLEVIKADVVDVVARDVDNTMEEEYEEHAVHEGDTESTWDGEILDSDEGGATGVSPGEEPGVLSEEGGNAEEPEAHPGKSGG